MSSFFGAGHLYIHLDNIESMKHTVNRIDMSSAGWTSVHSTRVELLEQSLKKGIPSFQADLDSCLKELRQKGYW